MAIEQSLNYSIIRGGQQAMSGTLTVSEEGETNLDVSLGVVTDSALGVALDVSEIRLLVIHADQDCTLETNDGAAPQETLAMTADVPLVWHHQMPAVAIGDIFAGDVTNVYATTTVATRIRIFCVLNVP